MITRFLGIFILAGFLGGCASGVGPSLEVEETGFHTGLSYTESDSELHPRSTEALPKLNKQFSLPTLVDPIVSQWNRTVEVAPNANASCLPDGLRAIVIKAGRHFGKNVIITSAHRSARRNRRVGGAKGSYHIHCQAVDMRVPGVSKSRLARFIRSLPERGGLGTYCGKGIVHVDLGPRREWHYGCRKNRVLAQKKEAKPSVTANKVSVNSTTQPARLKLLGIKSSL